MKIIYVAGQYTADTPEAIQANIDRADAAGRALLRLGYAPVVPHKNSAGWENDDTLNYDDFLKADFAILSKCDGVLLLDGWMKSKGAVMEKDYALKLGIPRYADISLLEDEHADS